MKNDTRIQSVVSNTQPEEPVSRGTRTVWVVRASFEIRAYVGFREGQLTLVNHSRS